MSSRWIVLIIAFLVLGHGASFSEDRPPTASEQEFCRLDKNNDRELSLEEFSTCEFYKLEQVKALPFLDMQDLKKDSSGNVSEEDLKAYLFKKADRDRNGKIDRKEWEEFYNSLMEPGGGISRGRLDRR